MTSEEYGQYIDDFELGADVMPGESLTEYIERRRREFESKADGGVIGIEVKIADEMAKGGRVGLFSGGALKGLASLFKSGKDKIADFAETQANKKMFRSADDIPPTSISQAKGPMTIEMMEAVDPSIVKKVLRTQELGLYEETPEILKAANLLERFTKKVKGKRVIDYERAEDILGVKLKGNETLDELFKIEFQTRPENRLTDSPFKDFEEYVLKGEKKADGDRVGLFMGGPALEGQALQIYNSMNAYGFSDQEIADALSARGLYTAPGSGTGTETTQSNIIGAQLDQGGGGGGITELQETFTRAAGSTPKFSQDAFFGLGKFLQGKERGTLGTRLANQPRLPLPASIAAYSMSPFNPDSKNYNPDFADQLNFLELGDDMIGMSGTGLKYGSGSVLAGQNVISGFGSNNYLTQLNKYINRKNITDKARQKGIDERNAFLAAQEKKNQERIAAERAAGAAANQAMQRQAGGGGGGNLTRSRSQGGLGLSASQAQAVSAANQAAGMGGFGLKEGGLATMFTRRR